MGKPIRRKAFVKVLHGCRQARAVRCRLKCHNERNPYLQLLTGHAEDAGETAVVRCEEGGDDVKSARPLRPGLHVLQWGYRRPLPGDRMPIPKTSLSSDRSLQPDFVKAGFASNRASAMAR